MLFASQFGVGESLAADLRHDQREAVGIVQGVVFRGTLVKPEYLFSNVAIKMIGFNSNVGSTQAAFQQRPEVFDALPVDFTANVFVDVVDRLVNVLAGRKLECPIFCAVG